jgi:co-chaperonin GroES (HSP10)
MHARRVSPVIQRPARREQPFMLKKRLLVVGDHIMVRPEIQGKTRAGLYLPPSVAENEAVTGGWVVQVGPGLALPYPFDSEEEPWKRKENRPRYIPPPAQEGDFAIFLRKASVEISFEDDKYLIVPNAAVLALVREELDGPDL